MDSALIVSGGERGIEALSQILRQAGLDRLATVPTAARARQLLMEGTFSLCLINAPLPDETGERLALDLAARGECEVVLCLRAQEFEQVSSRVEGAGVLTVSKPLHRTLFWNTLKVAMATHRRVQRFRAENARLSRMLEDMRVIDRAKWQLITHRGLSEEEAHRFLEKQSMDTRRSKREVAEEILRAYAP